MEGLVIANGLGAGGLTMGPYAGQLLAQLITGQTPDLDLSAFDPLRQPGPAANVSPLVR
jgi:D-amino-acid dehydrogenase